MIIFGAGLAGLLAANMLRKFNPIIYEQQSSLPNNHTALLRHRELKISEATSIPFKEVTVRKAINYDGKLFFESSHYFSNLYSKKVIGSYQDRSINNLNPVKRYIAPQDFIERLAIGCSIKYGESLNFHSIIDIAKEKTPIISTLPMPFMWAAFSNNTVPEFEFRDIVVVTATIDDDCDVYQTVYYPNPKLQIYRMSITGNKIIAEFIGSKINEDWHERHGVLNIEEYITHFLVKDFGIISTISNVQTKNNKYGKIKEINNAERKQFISELTKEYNIYSLGRFATWRNILLDDAHDDIMVIQKLIQNNGYYTGAQK